MGTPAISLAKKKKSTPRSDPINPWACEIQTRIVNADAGSSTNTSPDQSVYVLRTVTCPALELPTVVAKSSRLIPLRRLGLATWTEKASDLPG